MASGVFNTSLGKVAYYATLPAASDALIVVLLKTGVVDDPTMATYRTLADVLGGNTEADFTNYTRKVLTPAQSIDDSNRRLTVDAVDFLYTSAGGAANNDIAKLIVCYDPDTATSTDADRIPLTYQNSVFTTDGSDQPITVAATGLFRAAA